MADSDLVLRQPKHWKAMSHPLRLAIVGQLAQREMTNEELAAAIGQPSGKLYFHTKKLLDTGLIELSLLRRKAGLTEKVYRLAASGYKIPLVEDGSAPALSHFIENALSLYVETWRKQKGADFLQYGFHWTLYQIPEKEAEFNQRLVALMREFEESAVPPDHPDAKLVSFAMLSHRVE